jgi:hypothetical protein
MRGRGQTQNCENVARSQKPRNTGSTPVDRNLGFVVFSVLFSIPFVVAGVYLARTSWKAARLARASSDWPRETVTLERCEAVETPDGDGGKNHSVEILFAYEHSGRHYTGRTLSYRALSFPSRQAAEAFSAKLRQEPKLTAAVNPRAPVQSVLLPGGALSDYAGLVFGLTFAGFALSFVLITALTGAGPSAEQSFAQPKTQSAARQR